MERESLDPIESVWDIYIEVGLLCFTILVLEWLPDLLARFSSKIVAITTWVVFYLLWIAWAGPIIFAVNAIFSVAIAIEGFVRSIKEHAFHARVFLEIPELFVIFIFFVPFCTIFVHPCWGLNTGVIEKNFYYEDTAA